MVSAGGVLGAVVPAERPTAATASLQFRTAVPLQPATGYTQCLKCRAILRAQRAAGREVIPKVWLRRVLFVFLGVLLFLTGRESRNSDGSQVRSLEL